jgi:hypothetical protein
VIGIWKLRAFGGDAQTERTSKNGGGSSFEMQYIAMIKFYQSSFIIELTVVTIPTISLTAE